MLHVRPLHLHSHGLATFRKLHLVDLTKAGRSNRLRALKSLEDLRDRTTKLSLDQPFTLSQKVQSKLERYFLQVELPADLEAKRQEREKVEGT